MVASKGHTNCLAVFTKPAVPGRVKTRLVGPLSAEQAARLHAAFLEDLLERLAPGPFDLEIAWALAEGEPIPPAAYAGVRQEGRDLGERLFHALSGAARRFPRVAAVGSDHPDLPLERVVEAFRRLEEGAEVVVGPARDGGYYLLGARREALTPELFENIPWSAPGVLEATLERSRSLGLAVHLLPQGSDVDTPEDLRRLTDLLASDATSCPHTRALLAELGWL